MQRVITILGFSLLTFTWVVAQEGPDFNRVNTETYRFYMEQKWDSLIHLGKEALRGDVDYYYLRMRMGIACFSKKNYRTAAQHFAVALEQNNGDPAALEYLYYCRLYSGQGEQAQHVQAQFKGDLTLKLPPWKGKFFGSIGAEYLYQAGADDHLFADPGGIYPLDVAGTQSTTGYLSNATVSLVNHLAPGIVLSHAYTYLWKSSHYFYNDGESAIYLPDQRLIQNQYYLSPRFTTPSGYTFMPMFHVLGIKYQAIYDNGQGYQGGSSLVLGTLHETDFVTGMGFKKNLGRVDLDLGGWYGHLNSARQIQGRAGFTWFPLGNLNLYAGGYLNSQYEVFSGAEGVTRFLPEFLFGFGIAEKVWLDLNGTVGEMTNYLEGNGMIVYNSFSEIIDKKFRLSLSVPLTDKGSLFYVGGIWSVARSVFQPDGDPGTMVFNSTVSYNALSIYGGISWKF
jgi:hypothetical protein